MPPSTAARACSVTRTTLLSGCCAVSVEPPVWLWKRIIQLFGFLAPKRSRMIRAHSLRAARNLATSSKRSLWALKKKREPRPEGVDVEPGLDRGLHVGDAVGESEGELLRGGGARLADMVAARWISCSNCGIDRAQ